MMIRNDTLAIFHHIIMPNQSRFSALARHVNDLLTYRYVTLVDNGHLDEPLKLKVKYIIQTNIYELKSNLNIYIYIYITSTIIIP